MPSTKCKENACPHDIVFSDEKVISLIGGASVKSKNQVDQSTGVGTSQVTLNLTLECILKHRHNYSITFDQ